MNTFPSLEGRLSALEHRQVNLEGRFEDFSKTVMSNIKDLSDDMKASFKQLVQYEDATEKQIEENFTQVNTRLNKMGTRLDGMEMHLGKVEMHLDTIDGNISQLKAEVNTQTVLLTQILARLPERP